jgi:hypothetical protein
VPAGENLYGKYLLRTPHPKMTAEDIAPGYKQLLEVEGGWRDPKQITELPPEATTARKNGSAPASSSTGSPGISTPSLGR